MRLIDADRANVEEIPSYYGDSCRSDDIQEWLDEQPTVYVNSSNRAAWEDGPGRSVEILRDWYLRPTYICSVCKKEENRASSYCPNCGACMDLGCHYE